MQLSKDARRFKKRARKSCHFGKEVNQGHKGIARPDQARSPRPETAGLYQQRKIEKLPLPDDTRPLKTRERKSCHFGKWGQPGPLRDCQAKPCHVRQGKATPGHASNAAAPGLGQRKRIHVSKTETAKLQLSEGARRFKKRARRSCHFAKEMNQGHEEDTARPDQAESLRPEMAVLYQQRKSRNAAIPRRYARFK